jgi:hypothetical protein
MKKSISVRHEKRGRPATGKTPTVTLRLPVELSARIDAWAMAEVDAPVRSEAIRRILEIGLAKSSPSDPLRATHAAEVAECAIDKVKDPTVAEDEQASRKRRLLQGPEEFRAVRVDGPKTKRT